VYYKVQPYGFQRMAHNSFMETLYDYGIVGLVLLLLILLKLVIEGYRMFKEKYNDVMVWGYTMVPMLAFGIVSYFFEQTVIIVPFVIAWGTILGNYKKTRCENNSLRE
jgi:O-antigen ligase